MYTPSDEEMAKVEAEAERQVEKLECEKRIWNLFDLAIEKNKELGFTDQDIQMGDIPLKDLSDYGIVELKAVLVREGLNRLSYILIDAFEQVFGTMRNNRLCPSHIYMNPIMATSLTYSPNPHAISLFGCFYFLGLSPSLPPNVFYVCPGYEQTGVCAFPLFNEFITLSENICLENYVDLPDEVNKCTGFRLLNVKAPYRVTVPASLLK